MIMDELDCKLLNLIQKGLPIVEFPFHKLAEDLGIGPDEVITRLEKLKKEGYIRRIGALLNTSKMGYTSALFAMEVPEAIFDYTASIVNSYNGVTHNYRREDSLNMWFTLTVRCEEEKRAVIEEIKQKTGIKKVYEFQAERLFKLNVFFDMEGAKDGASGQY